MELPTNQWRRLDRMRCERHFLLDVKIDDAKRCILTVSGSTGNIYTLTLDKDGIVCNCPDFDGHADVDEVYCKHCCFVIYRVLSSNITADDVQPRRLNSEKLSAWQKVLEDNSLKQFKHVISPQLCEKYQRIETEEKFCDNSILQDFGVVMPDKCKIKEKLEDMCGICYEELNGKNMLIECGECFNLLHQECADIWLRKGTVETCVYCRAPLVYALYLQNKERSVKKRKTEGEYKNILD